MHQWIGFWSGKTSFNVTWWWIMNIPISHHNCIRTLMLASKDFLRVYELPCEMGKWVMVNKVINKDQTADRSWHLMAKSCNSFLSKHTNIIGKYKYLCFKFIVFLFITKRFPQKTLINGRITVQNIKQGPFCFIYWR